MQLGVGETAFNWIDAVSHLLFPRLCFGCEEHVIDNNEFLCLNCFSDLPFTKFESIRDNSVEKLFWGRTKIAFAFSTVYYHEQTPVQRAIHALKYKNQPQLGIFLGEIMSARAEKLVKNQKIDLLIPMPLHPKKQRKRGYNQATKLCQGFSKNTNIPFKENLLKRIKATTTQTHKSRLARWENVESVFEVSEAAEVSGKNVLLMDDVITTGASTEACINKLIEAGVNQVSVCSFAFTA